MTKQKQEGGEMNKPNKLIKVLQIIGVILLCIGGIALKEKWEREHYNDKIQKVER